MTRKFEDPWAAEGDEEELLPDEIVDRLRERVPRPLVAQVLFMDAALVVVDKPAGLLTVPGRSREPFLAENLRGRSGLPADEPFHTVHRLDREASGVVVFARTPEAQRLLSERFGARRVEKSYLALVNGYVTRDGEVDLPIAANENGTRAEVSKRHGKDSVTRYVIQERFPGLTLLECRPLTGRLHQIRVHLSAIGFPLAVDPLYGGASALFLSRFKPGYKPSGRHEERPLIDRLTLHAARIAFEHPEGTGTVTFEAPLPKDFRATLAQLRRLGGSTGRAHPS